MGKCTSLQTTTGLQNSNTETNYNYRFVNDKRIEQKTTDEIKLLETKQKILADETDGKAVTKPGDDSIMNEDLKQQVDELKEKLDILENENKEKHELLNQQNELIIKQDESLKSMQQKNTVLQMQKDYIKKKDQIIAMQEQKIAGLTSGNKEIEANILKSIEDTDYKLPMKHVLTEPLQSEGYYVWEWRISAKKGGWYNYNESISKSIERLKPGETHTYTLKNGKVYKIRKDSNSTGTECTVSLAPNRAIQHKDSVAWPCRKTNKIKYKYKLEIGTEIVIEEMKGNFMRISAPYKGWFPFMNLKFPSMDSIDSKSGHTKISILKSVLQVGDVIAIHLLQETNWNVRSAIDKYYNSEYVRDTGNIKYSFVWQWMDDASNWKMYAEEQTSKITALPIGSIYKFSVGGHNYRFDKLSDVSGEQINLKTNKKRKAKSIKVKKIVDVKYPEFWNNDGVMYHDFDQKEMYCLSSDNIPIEEDYIKPKRIQIDLNSSEAQKIISEFYVNVSEKTISIFKIESVQNRFLWDKYYGARRSLKKSIGKHKLNEMHLWHGTKIDTVQTIITQGFRKEFNYKTVWGEGTYFAKWSRYAMNFCKSSNRAYQILYCKVLCGEVTLGGKHIKLTNWPLKRDGSGQIYDCLVNKSTNPTIYVIHDDIRAYPLFIVHFLLN